MHSHTEAYASETKPVFDFKPYLFISKESLKLPLVDSLTLNPPQKAQEDPKEFQIQLDFTDKASGCGHKWKQMFSKNMCLKCYMAQRKPATNCRHSDRPTYAKGKCISCYQCLHKQKQRAKKRREA